MLAMAEHSFPSAGKGSILDITDSFIQMNRNGQRLARGNQMKPFFVATHSTHSHVLDVLLQRALEICDDVKDM